MKRIPLLVLCLLCFCSLGVFAQSPCEKEVTKSAYEMPCLRPTKQVNECFLCTCKSIDSMFNCLDLSDIQKCNTKKIQENYNLEVLSLNDRINCEKQKLCQLKQNCAKWKEIYKQKREIKRLEKEQKKICKCYEKEFLTTLSKDQQKAYNKFKRSK